MRRFFVDAGAVSDGRITIADPRDVHHMRDVLRMGVGDAVAVSDRVATEYVAHIAELDAGRAVLDIVSSGAFSHEPDVHITLYQGVPKGAKMDTVIQKSIELGASRIVPLLAKRAMQEYGGGMEAHVAKKLERWRRIAAETVKQCRRGIAPEVADALDAAGAAAEIASGAVGPAFVLDELEEALTLKAALRRAFGESPAALADAGRIGRAAHTAGPARDAASDGTPESPALPQAKPRLAFVVGPEGGLERPEVAALAAAGASAVTVGNTILRTETAGPCAIAMAIYELTL